ncbi:ABC transporter permease [Adhaeribacter pallidiroseus]|uniref:Macrolide export ATP-binding/permease protein MacB n=1 Tax=Adhaeribacter pallidiroseus TaxID=2072847 RepID=A0A369QPF3_9BACT|nr:ABC transporter permease [Adhaeribacter pallidiroseus]RDC65545.1 Macrolide export ATP-binding/permease protein MacB [Adhaeribacter pallidiroseus]
MPYNYFKIAGRTLLRQKGFSFLNITGLSLGLATSLLILLWVVDELQFDGFHKRIDRLYVVLHHLNFTNGEIRTGPDTQGLLAPALKENFPEIVDATRVSFAQERILKIGEKAFKEQGHFADPNFFKIFSFPLLIGDAKTVLQDISSIVISQSFAQKHFGNVPQALGKVIQIGDADKFVVSGVFRDVPKNSSLQFEYVLPFEVLFQNNHWLRDWGASSIQTFVLLHDNAGANAVSSKIENFVKKQAKASISTLMLQPLKQFYLYNKFENGQPAGGRIVYVRLFSVVAIFILLIACINFMNLATARSAQRAKEVGVRKVIGASRTSLISQLLTESFLLALVSMVIALAVVTYALPFFNQLTGKSICLPFTNPAFFLTVISITLFTSLLAGSYPALFLSAFQSVQVLKGTIKVSAGARFLRQGLVVFQFVLSTGLIVSTGVVYRQIQYMKNKNLGLNQENLIYFQGTGGVLNHFEAYRTELLAQPGISKVAQSSQELLGSVTTSQSLNWEGKNPRDIISFQVIQADADFIPTMGAKLKEGRNFSPHLATDSLSYIVNEEALKIMGLPHPVGQKLSFQGKEGKIIGLVQDFHVSSLHDPIMPVLITLRPQEARMIYVRTRSGQAPQAIASLQKLHLQFESATPFEYHFLDQSCERIYRHDRLVSKLATGFAFISIFISCLGLFGLVTFTVQQRTKEIGIRKVLGASVRLIVALLSKDFLKLVLLANIIAWPLAGWAMHQWLQDFAYRTNLGWEIFALAGATTVFIALLTISLQAIKAAVANPINALRSE